MDFKKWNLITGWLTFGLAALVYLSTIEPTSSFWDTGEFITTAYKLEIGHPPGAPLFMLLGRIFAAFVPTDMVAGSINVLSALASAFTILFLFWSITHFAYKMALAKAGDVMNDAKVVAILASGFVGAMAFTFSDSFWFSAVEGEVYAMSSLFTAVVFWAILKWETLSNGRNEMRWIILIAYLMGLSIGVHLLNLLAIPAICFVFYFKKYKPTARGIIVTTILSVLILGAIQSGIIPGVVSWAGDFELLFVNSFGLPFNTGIIVYALLVIGLLTAGLIWTRRTRKPAFHTAILAVAVIILGYSTYATIVIRSSANPPLDENNPENVFLLLSYLNREQYGDRPLLYGQYWNSPLDQQKPKVDGAPTYTKLYLVQNAAGRTLSSFSEDWEAREYQKKTAGAERIEHQYVMTNDGKEAKYNYDDQFCSIFPRMYSPQENHIQAYKNWSDFEGKPIQTTVNGQLQIINKPTMSENLRFFTRYQVNFMYWRYFMWNFAGRQNDIQGHGNLTDGNWLSGVDFIDEERLGSQDNLPVTFTENFAYNRFFMIPLLLGLFGLAYQLYKKPSDWLVTLLLFLLTGIAIVVYLNQYPYQPRERDYAYTGSFYAFAIWIGLGVYAFFDTAFNITRQQLQKTGAFVGSAVVLFFIFESASDGHHYFSYSILYLGGIITILMLIMFLLGQKVKNKMVLAVLALIIGLPAPAVMAIEGWNDHDRSDRYTARDFAENYLNSCQPNAVLFTNGDNDTFPLWYAQEVEGVRTDVRVVNLSLLNTDWYINSMRRQAYESDPLPFGMAEEKYRGDNRNILVLDESRNKDRVPINITKAMEFVANDKNLQNFGGGEKYPVLPSKNFFIPVNKQAVLDKGVVAPEDAEKIVDRVSWRIDRPYVTKNHMMMMDLLANFDWNRPVYYAVTMPNESYLNLENYFELEGLAYHLVPISHEASPNPNLMGSVNADVMYDNIMTKFKWGGMDGKQIYMDENNRRMTNNLRLQFANLADQLIQEEKIEKAKNVLDKAVEVMPDRNVPFDRLMLPIIENYYKIGEADKANEILLNLFDKYEDEFEYYASLDPEWAIQMRQNIQMAYAILQRSQMLVTQIYPQEGLADEVEQRFNQIESSFDQMIQNMEAQRTGSRIQF